MIYQRPDKGSLKQWADQVGDQSFTWDNMLPYFAKHANFNPPRPSRFPNATVPYNTSVFPATDGPLQLSFANYANPFSTWLGAAFNEIGVKEADDFVSGNLVGGQFCTSTIDPRTASRSSSQTAFLETAQARSNLKVFYLTLAKKILFDGKKAKGVLVASGDVILAKKEVIVSAGAFQSPQLLMVSGIGPAKTLQSHGIPVIADRPGVGQNLTDHIVSTYALDASNPVLPKYKTRGSVTNVVT
jgi:choline dehydrogenase-like flavoprotein